MMFGSLETTPVKTSGWFKTILDRPKTILDRPASSRKWRKRKKDPPPGSPPYLANLTAGKDRLLAIVVAEKASTLKPEVATGGLKTIEVSCNSSTATTISDHDNGLLVRLRRSFRKKTNNLMKRNPDLSHDSGLGEDSDASHRTTPNPALTPNPILRRFSHNGGPGCKQVMIREPSLRHLPSALRHSFPGAATPSPVRLEQARHGYYRHSYQADNLAQGDVGPQWGRFYFRAAQEVARCLRYLNMSWK